MHNSYAENKVSDIAGLSTPSPPHRMVNRVGRTKRVGSEGLATRHK
jgi:hypothetical protein